MIRAGVGVQDAGTWRLAAAEDGSAANASSSPSRSARVHYARIASKDSVPSVGRSGSNVLAWAGGILLPQTQSHHLISDSRSWDFRAKG